LNLIIVIAIPSQVTKASLQRTFSVARKSLLKQIKFIALSLVTLE